MSLLCDTQDPTTALFLSVAGASRAAKSLMASKYADRVNKAVPKARRRRGELLGYALIIHFNDKRPSTPLTNSDFERITGA